MASRGALSLSEIRKIRSSTYNVGHVQEFAEMFKAGKEHLIPADFSFFLSDYAPTTRDEVALWLHCCLEKNGLIGKFSNRPNDLQPTHTSHVDFIADSFLEDTGDCIVLGPRKGAKTLAFSALMLMESIYKGADIAHLGAIKEQAARCYEYYLKMLRHKLFSKFISGKPNKTKVQTVAGAKVEILVGTMTGVNSPHPIKAQLDEVELMEWSILQEAMSMAASKGRYKSATRLTSTRKFASGTMQKMIDEADERGFKLYKWNIWDVVERCPMKTSKMITVQVPKELCPEELEDVEVPKDCSKCSLLTTCQGKAKYSHGGIIPLTDAMKNFDNLDSEVWLAQCVCSVPGKSDLIYSNFEESIHVLESYDFDPLKPIYAGGDAGFNSPAMLYAQELEDGVWVVFDEVEENEIAPSTLVQTRLVPLQGEYNTELYVVDPNGLQLIAEMEKEHLNVIAGNNDVEVGLDLVRSMFNLRRLYISKKCRRLIWEVKNYRKGKTGKPVKKDDHFVDSLRYLMMEVGFYYGELSEVHT